MFTANLLDIHEQVVRSRSGRTYMSENLDRISKAFISALLVAIPLLVQSQDLEARP